MTTSKDRKDHNHTGSISPQKFEAVQLEMAIRSNVEMTEDGPIRKTTKYSSKKKKKE